jgi:membrane fusion protein, adhesin transport system
MLNITDNELHCGKDLENLASFDRIRLSPWHLSFRNLLLVMLAIFLVFMFLPWTQNIRANGKLTALSPEQRPQTIPSTIAGKIDKWYVQEGQFVKKGDTIIFLTEVKTDYFDPQLVERVGNQVDAKKSSVESYSGKIGALENQISAMQRELISKISQLENKVEQKRLKIISDSIGIIQAENDIKIAQRQFDAMKPLYEKGYEPLTKFEERRLKLVDAQTKLVKARNDLDITRNEFRNAQLELTLTRNEYANKIAKSQSDKFASMSDKFEAEASVNKLQIERESYRRRSAFYHITAPQDGYVVKAIEAGIGEYIKEGDAIVTILPDSTNLAVEMYVKPIDVPLLSVGRIVRFQFDGWPAFFFSGWPGLSFGTYPGRVVAIDRNISTNGKFRVLVAPSAEDTSWPTALRVGGGAHGIALLNNVPLWYELWRMLNGFPPDMYKQMADVEKKEEK